MPSDNLKIDYVELFARDNAREHRTERYELIRDNHSGRVILKSIKYYVK